MTTIKCYEWTKKTIVKAFILHKRRKGSNTRGSGYAHPIRRVYKGNKNNNQFVTINKVNIKNNLSITFEERSHTVNWFLIMILESGLF